MNARIVADSRTHVGRCRLPFANLNPCQEQLLTRRSSRRSMDTMDAAAVRGTGPPRRRLAQHVLSLSLALQTRVILIIIMIISRSLRLLLFVLRLGGREKRREEKRRALAWTDRRTKRGDANLASNLVQLRVHSTSLHFTSAQLASARLTSPLASTWPVGRVAASLRLDGSGVGSGPGFGVVRLCGARDEKGERGEGSDEQRQIQRERQGKARQARTLG